MLLHVGELVALRHESLVADAALERALVRVRTNVRLQVARLMELFQTRVEGAK